VRRIALATSLAFALLGAALPAPRAAAKEPKPPPETALSKAIDLAVRGVSRDFWGTVLAARKGEVVFAKGYGFADYEKRPCAVDTLYEIASTSKQFTATAILRLEQQKRLKTSDTLDKHFENVPADKRKVTIDHLLHHTSGFDDKVASVPYAWEGSRERYVEGVLSKRLASEPGKAYAYSNVGYAVLAAIVEQASGKEFEEYVRKELFAPAGLVDTGFIGDDRLVKSDRVTVRKCDDCEPGWTCAKWWYGWGYRGMGGVVTTAPDLLKWDRALRGDKVLNAAEKAKLYEPALESYACGWEVGTAEGGKKVSHSGGVRGYACVVSRWLDADAVVIVLSNGKVDPYAVERAVAGALF
jgi:CubicO group peptidase (beta-lactamase class C family)